MDTRAQKRKRLPAVLILFTVFFAAVFLILLSPPPTVANATTGDSPEHHYFKQADEGGGASAIAADSGTVYIADENRIYTCVYANGKYSVSETALFTAADTNKIIAMAYSNNKLYTVENYEGAFGEEKGVLAVYSLPAGTRDTFAGLPVSSGFTALAVRGNNLYAIRGDKRIHILNTDTNSYISNVDAADRVFGLTTGTTNANDLFFAVRGGATDGNLRIYRRSSAGAVDIWRYSLGPEDCRSMAHDKTGKYLALVTKQAVRIFNVQSGGEVIQTLENPNGNILHITAGFSRFQTTDNTFYAFGDDAALRVIEPPFSSATVLFAARSDLPGFYNTPADIASRGGRIFVADQHNNRISVKSGDSFRAISLSRDAEPRSVATDTDGFLYFAYERNGIAKYKLNDSNASNTEELVFSFTFRPDDNAIAQLQADSWGNLFVLTDNARRLYKLPVTQNGLYSGEYGFVNGIGNAPVYRVAAGLNRPELFAAIDGSAAGSRKIVRIFEDAVTQTGIEVSNFIDMSADADGSIYVLSGVAENYQITRWDYDKEDSAAPYKITRPPYQIPTKVGTRPSNILVSAIDDTVFAAATDKSVQYRDILIVDSNRHEVATLSRAQFGITVEEPVNLLTYTETDPDEEIIRYLTADAPIFSIASDAFPIMRATVGGTATERVVLKKGSEEKSLRVIVEKFNPDSDYSLIIADNADPALGEPLYQGGIFIGFIRNKYLSKPIEYQDPDETDKQQFVTADTAYIYRYPLPYLPVELRETRIKSDPAVEKLRFVFMRSVAIETADNGETFQSEYGYVDNYGYGWYKVAYGENLSKTGYMLADTVDALGAVPPADINKNAKIIADSLYPGQAHAPVFYRDESGNMIEDDRFAAALPVGIKVEVIMLPFDSSREYTLIRFSHNGSVFERFVRTVNLSFEGIDTLKIIAIVTTLTALSLMGIVAGRYRRIKRNLMPKDPAVNYE